VNESERLVAVHRYNILDTPSDGAFDRITGIAARLLKVPIALISIVDHDRIWFINAARHGALSSGEGSVSFIWELAKYAPSQKWLRMTWREWDGPPVLPPTRKGFGHLVLERLVPEGLGGEAVLSFAQEGVVWSCETPSSRILQ
jgi:hypothetical protein